MKDLTPEEAGRWLDAAPPLVQEAVMSPSTEQVVERIAKEHALHIDQAGLLEKLVSYTLIGSVGPGEFLKELRVGGLDDSTARQVVSDVNKGIFVPLRARMEGMEAGERKPEPVRRPAPPPPMPPIPSAPRPMPPLHPPPPAPIAKMPPVSRELLLEDHEEPSPTLERKIPAPTPAAPIDRTAVPPAGRPYTVDPYREPVDDNTA